MLTNPQMILRGLKVVTYTVLGKDMPLETPDRYILEQKIILIQSIMKNGLIKRTTGQLILTQ
jgi:hypothetical protein